MKLELVVVVDDVVGDVACPAPLQFWHIVDLVISGERFRVSAAVCCEVSLTSLLLARHWSKFSLPHSQLAG